MNTQKKLSRSSQDNIYQTLIKDIRDAAFKTGYYQATLEKCELTEAEREEYTDLNRDAIKLRNRKHGDLLAHISNSYNPKRGALI